MRVEASTFERLDVVRAVIEEVDMVGLDHLVVRRPEPRHDRLHGLMLVPVVCEVDERRCGLPTWILRLGSRTCVPLLPLGRQCECLRAHDFIEDDVALLGIVATRRAAGIPSSHNGMEAFGTEGVVHVGGQVRQPQSTSTIGGVYDSWTDCGVFAIVIVLAAGECTVNIIHAKAIVIHCGGRDSGCRNSGGGATTPSATTRKPNCH